MTRADNGMNTLHLGSDLVDTRIQVNLVIKII